MTLATRGRSRTRERIAAGSISRPGSAAQVLEQDRLDVLEVDAPRGRHERPDLASADEPPTTELDALQAARPRPAADRRRAEMDVGGGQDLGRFGKGDPVGRGDHRQSEAVDAPDLDGLSAFSFDFDVDVVVASDEPDSDFLAGELSPSDDAAAPDVDASSEPPLPLEAFFAAAVAVERRSFLAQPDPL